MATKFERGLFKIVLAIGGVLGSYMTGIVIYTVIYGNSLWYNFGYSVGYITKKISSIF